MADDDAIEREVSRRLRIKGLELQEAQLLGIVADFETLVKALGEQATSLRLLRQELEDEARPKE